MAYEHDEVIRHFPPQFIPGKQVGEPKLIKTVEDERVTVNIYEVENEFIYSNPTGLFNLSLPDKLVRCQVYPPQFLSYE